MTRPPSIFRRLVLGFALMSVIGGSILLLFVGVEYGLSSRSRRDEIQFVGIINEVADHVVVPLLVLIAPMTLAALWVIRSSLRPLGVAAARIEAAHAADKGFRVEVEDFPAEATGFADAVNGLLARLDGAATRQEAFAADVAHELRTPLAVLALELDRLDSEDGRRLKQDVAAMSRLVDQLLILAQLDAQSAAPATATPVDLAEIAAEIVAQYAPFAIDEGKAVALVLEPAQAVEGRREAIAAALRNLVENGLRVTPPGGVVTVTAGPGPRLSVIDGGPGLALARLAELSQRYRRGDHASGSGAGLGLAIVSRIMAAHGGRIETRPDRSELILDFALSGKTDHEPT
ncbi:MAG: HAMP domain-containing histidine kinase [Rhizobiaceae bacterium]|nr:HAMP domain-containing histidine kinase [Rhizobiaceae bacterium]